LKLENKYLSLQKKSAGTYCLTSLFARPKNEFIFEPTISKFADREQEFFEGK
jgi:hypothetical protein